MPIFKDDMKKRINRVKQFADQTFARAEKTEVLTEDLITAEKRVDQVKSTFQNVSGKLQSCLQSGKTGANPSGVDAHQQIEKRLKKMPDMVLGCAMVESGQGFGDNSILGSSMSFCGQVQQEIAAYGLAYEIDIEKNVIGKMNDLLENDIPSVSKQRKHLNKLTLDMDSAKSRYLAANRHSGTGSNSTTAVKVETIKDELEETQQKVELCRDGYAADMFALMSRETELSMTVLHFLKAQRECHAKALQLLDQAIPDLESQIENSSSKPVYGVRLEEHLRVTERDIALPIEVCVEYLFQYGMDEEGLFRVAGSSSRVKKLKNAFDVGCVDADVTRDPFSVADALKSYLRELPNPLMTKELYEEWINAASISDQCSRVGVIVQILKIMPQEYLTNLGYLVTFLSNLASNNDVNKMSSQNLAIVMGPNLMWSPEDDSNDAFGITTRMGLNGILVETLITNCGRLFPNCYNFGVKWFTSRSNQSLENDSFTSSSSNRQSLETSGNPVQNEEMPNGSCQNAHTLKVFNGVSPQSTSPKIYRRNKKPAPPVPPPPKERNNNSPQNQPEPPKAQVLNEVVFPETKPEKRDSVGSVKSESSAPDSPLVCESPTLQRYPTETELPKAVDRNLNLSDDAVAPTSDERNESTIEISESKAGEPKPPLRHQRNASGTQLINQGSFHKRNASATVQMDKMASTNQMQVEREGDVTTIQLRPVPAERATGFGKQEFGSRPFPKPRPQSVAVPPVKPDKPPKPNVLERKSSSNQYNLSDPDISAAGDRLFDSEKPGEATTVIRLGGDNDMSRSATEIFSDVSSLSYQARSNGNNSPRTLPRRPPPRPDHPPPPPVSAKQAAVGVKNCSSSSSAVTQEQQTYL